MEYGLHSKQHHPHPWYRTKDEVVKNEQLTDLIYITASGVALSLGEAKSWDHLGGLKSSPDFLAFALVLNKACGFLCFLSPQPFIFGCRGLFLMESVWLMCFLFHFAFFFFCTKRDYVSFCHSQVMYLSPSQAYLSCTSSLIGEVCRAMQR